MSKRSKGYEYQKMKQTEQKVKRDEWRKNLDPKYKSLQKEAARLDRLYQGATPEEQKKIKKALKEIFAKFQDKLIPLRTYSTEESTSNHVETYKVHAKHSRKFLYE